ncbi:MAG TPA: HypC/HybG/HupF family hydrogenase formation chaperone [Solirubrobacterales bacterium]|jgi:hydrogenase maturation factor
MIDGEVRCLTCGDLAVPMRVAALDEDDSDLAMCVAEDGARCEVDIGLIPGVARGESLLVHAGAALARLPEGSAERP